MPPAHLAQCPPTLKRLDHLLEQFALTKGPESEMRHVSSVEGPAAFLLPAQVTFILFRRARHSWRSSGQHLIHLLQTVPYEVKARHGGAYMGRTGIDAQVGFGQRTI